MFMRRNVDKYRQIHDSEYMTKVSLNITVDLEVLEKFRSICNKNDIKISTKINTLMKEWINRNNEGRE